MVHHRRGLRRLLRDDAVLAAVEGDFEEAGRDGHLGEKRVAMLRYALKLTVRPGAMEERDVESLRDVGWSDRDILEIAEVTAYYAYVNRIADGLGVQLEDQP